MPFGSQECRQEGRDRIVAALRAGGESRAEDRRRQKFTAEDGERTGSRCFLGYRFEDRGLADFAPNVEHQQRRQNAHKEQRAPRNFLRHELEDDGGENCRRAPAQRPGALHCAHSLAAIGAANHLAHQHRACRPFAAEAKTLEPAHDKQLLEILGEAGKKSEERKPGDHDAEHTRSADAVGEHAGDPASKGGNHQRARRQQSGLCLGDAPDRDQCGDHETVNLHVERVERPAAEARPERSALIRSELAVPIEHDPVWMDSRSDQTGGRHGGDAGAGGDNAPSPTGRGREGSEGSRRSGTHLPLSRSRIASPRALALQLVADRRGRLSGASRRRPRSARRSSPQTAASSGASAIASARPPAPARCPFERNPVARLFL